MACWRDDLVLAACKTLGMPATTLCGFVRHAATIAEASYLCTRSRSASAAQLVIFAAFVCMNKPYTVCTQCAAPVKPCATVCSASKAVHSVQQHSTQQ